MKLSCAPYYHHATHWKCSSIPNLFRAFPTAVHHRAVVRDCAVDAQESFPAEIESGYLDIQPGNTDVL